MNLKQSSSRVLAYVAAVSLVYITGWIGGSRHVSQAATQKEEISAAGNPGKARHSVASGRGATSPGVALPSPESPDFDNMVRTILREANERVRLERFSSLLGRSNEGHLKKMVSLVHEAELQGSSSQREWGSLWDRWGVVNGRSALTYIAGRDWSGFDPGFQEKANAGVLIPFAEADPQAALSCFGKWSESEQVTLQAALLKGWASSDPEGAATWLLHYDLSRDSSYAIVIEAISRTEGAERLDAWFESALATEKRTDSFPDLAQALLAPRLKSEPEQAAAWLENHLDLSWMKNSGLIEATARAYADAQPAQALEWAERNHLEAAVRESWLEWSGRKPDDALAWLNGHADSQSHESLAGMAAQLLAARDPERATMIAGTIRDEATRDRILGIIERRRNNNSGR